MKKLRNPQPNYNIDAFHGLTRSERVELYDMNIYPWGDYIDSRYSDLYLHKRIRGLVRLCRAEGIKLNLKGKA